MKLYYVTPCFDVTCSNLRAMSPSLCGNSPYPRKSLTYRIFNSCRHYNRTLAICQARKLKNFLFYHFSQTYHSHTARLSQLFSPNLLITRLLCPRTLGYRFVGVSPCALLRINSIHNKRRQHRNIFRTIVLQPFHRYVVQHPSVQIRKIAASFRIAFLKRLYKFRIEII